MYNYTPGQTHLNLDSAVEWAESTRRSTTIDELRIPLRTHWVKDAPPGIGIGVDLGNRFSLYDSDSDSGTEICADEESDCCRSRSQKEHDPVPHSTRK